MALIVDNEAELVRGGGRAPGDRGTIVRDRPTTFSRTPTGAQLYIETDADSDVFEIAQRIDWRTVHLGIDGADNTCDLVMEALDAKRLNPAWPADREHFHELLKLIHPDRRVRVAIPQGINGEFPLVLFQGWPMLRTITWTPDRQTFTCQAFCEGQERMRAKREAMILGRKMRRRPWKDPATMTPAEIAADLKTVQALPLFFNYKGRPNRLHVSNGYSQRIPLPNATIPAQIDSVYVFGDEDEEGCEFWNAAAAIRHLAKFHVEPLGIDCADLLFDLAEYQDLELDTTVSVEPFLAGLTRRLPGSPGQSLNVEEALKVVCAAAGLHFRPEPRQGNDGKLSWRLIVWAAVSTEAEELSGGERRMGVPVVADLPRDAPFSDYSALSPADAAERNAAQQTALTFDVRNADDVQVIGGLIELECTLLLRPGWYPHPMLDNIATVDQAATAEEFWIEKFGSDAASAVDEDTGLPISRYIASHPRHHTRIADFDPDHPGEGQDTNYAGINQSFSAVGRRWVFPDTFEYMFIAGDGSSFARTRGPWDSAAFWSPYAALQIGPPFIFGDEALIYVDSLLGGGLSGIDNWVLRRRPFGPLLSRASGSAGSQSPIVRVNYHATDPRTALSDPNWVQLDGAVELDKAKAALWISAENLMLDPRMRQIADDDSTTMISALIGRSFEDSDAPIAPHFFLSVTCTVADDARLVLSGFGESGYLRGRSTVKDYGLAQFRLVSRSVGNSHLKDVDTGDAAYDSRDDTERLQQQADKLVRASAGETISGDPEVPWIKTDVKPGDAFSGISGLGIRFGRFPQVVGIDYQKNGAAAFRTVYHLSDLRHVPEVSGE